MHSLSQQVHSIGNRLGGNSQCCHVPWSSRLLTNEEAESKIAGLSSPRKCTHTPLPLTSLALQLPCPATCPWGFLLHTGSWSAPVSSFSKALCTGRSRQAIVPEDIQMESGNKDLASGVLSVLSLLQRPTKGAIEALGAPWHYSHSFQNSET